MSQWLTRSDRSGWIFRCREQWSLSEPWALSQVCVERRPGVGRQWRDAVVAHLVTLRPPAEPALWVIVCLSLIESERAERRAYFLFGTQEVTRPQLANRPFAVAGPSSQCQHARKPAIGVYRVGML